MPKWKVRLLTAALAGGVFGAEAAADSVRRNLDALEAWCAQPGAAAAAEAEAPPPPVIIEGLGTSGIDPHSASAEARRWFDQGVRLVWAFDEVEAVRAFEEAQRLDPGCAMCFWGEAWARGPTINLRPRTEELAAARTAAERAVSLSRRLPQRERRLIRAMRVRTGDKDFRNERYAETMAQLAQRFPEHDGIAVIAADAGMVAAPRGGLREGSLPQRLLERVMARSPDHSGAIHMYIHLTDWIDRQDLAERPAERLGRVAPAASHLVHMPSHTFYGIGRYDDAAAVNVRAIAADRAFVERVRPAASDYRTGLLAHNMHFAMNSALIRGDGATALSVAEQYRAAFLSGTPSGGFRVIGSAVWFSEGLHRDPDAVLRIADPGEDQVLFRALRHYARGEAQARRGDSNGVRSEARAIAAILEGGDSARIGGRPATLLAEISQKVLEGRAAMLAGDHAAAEAAYREAMAKQAGAGFGSDPPLWWYSTRRSVAAALLARGNAADAREQLLASLEAWPNDPLALFALSRAEQALGNASAAADALRRARAGWAGDVAAVPLARI